MERPEWLERYITETAERVVHEPEEMMRIASELVVKNIQHNTGGPFGSIIVESLQGKIIGWGVNRIIPEQCCLFHGEIVAIWDAQQRLGTYDLGAPGMAPCILVTSAAPCAMCMGAICWSGVKKLIWGASAGDVERILGFDEGPVHPEIIFELNKRKIEVIPNVLQELCCQGLQQYAATNREIYNGGQGFRG